MFDVMFDQTLIEVQPGQGISIYVRMLGDNKLRGYYGFQGNSYKNIEENQDKDLFEITYSNGGSNGTSIESGQIPRLYYFLL
jgi:hypothetical protein